MEISLKYAERPKINAVSPYVVPDTLSNADCFYELEKLIGMQTVKRTLAEVTAFSLIQQKRNQVNLKTEPTALHMVFKGNPGTGKTTVARILGEILNEINVLSKGQLVEVERADLVGEYIGHTAQKTKEIIKKSIGGIMFVDEAYALAQGGEKDFGKEAIAAIVKAMEDHRDNLVVILAGYSNEIDGFIRSNPGLRSRFPFQIEFKDYNSEELFLIALQMYDEREYELTGKTRWKLKKHLNDFVKTRHPHSGNARYVRNIIEKSIRLQALRIVDREYHSRKDLLIIRDIDLPEPDQIYS